MGNLKIKRLKVMAGLKSAGSIRLEDSPFDFIKHALLPEILRLPKVRCSYVLLRLNGLGYRNWFLKNSKQLVMELGYSHYTCVDLNPFWGHLNLITRKDRLFVYGQNKQFLKNFVHFIYNLKKVNPYTLKGIRFAKMTYVKKLRKKDRMR